MKKWLFRIVFLMAVGFLAVGNISAGCVEYFTDKPVYTYGETITVTVYSDTCHFLVGACAVFDAGDNLLTKVAPDIISQWPQKIEYTWDQNDEYGQPVPPGTYRLVSPSFRIEVTILGTGILYGVSLRPTGTPPAESWKIAELVEINLGTGQAWKIGPVGAGLDQRQWSLDLSFTPDGRLWAVNGVTRWDNLVTIDTNTGAGTVVASTGTLIEGIAFAPGGSLFAADSGYNNWDERGDQLAVIDPSDFSYTVIGATNVDIDGLALSPDGLLYGVDSGTLVRVDRLTGVTTAVGLLGTGNFFAVTFGPDGIMYGVDAAGDIYTVDPETAVVSYVCSTGFPYMAGLEFATLKLPAAMDDMIRGLPDECFKNQPDRRKDTFHNKLAEVAVLIDSGDYEEAVAKLTHDIRPKIDGEGNNDWITCPSALDRLLDLIDSLITYLAGLI